MPVNDLFALGAVIAVWVIVQKVILPKLGLPS
jgi:hypothetical protein